MVDDAAPVPPPSPSPLAPLASTALLISPFFFWGSSMAAMKVVEPHTTPLFVAAVRLLPAGAAVIAWAAARGRPQPTGTAAWLAIAAFAAVDGAAFQGCLAEGLRRTSAGLGSVVIDSQPLTVAALSALLYGERLTAAGVAGLVAGVAGLALLEAPPETLAAYLPGPMASALGVPVAVMASAATRAAAEVTTSSSSLWDSGAWWMLLAAQAMAVGTVMVPWVTRPKDKGWPGVDPVMATGWHMVLGGVPLVAAAVFREGADLSTRLPQLTATDVTLLLYVSLLGSAAAYAVFFYNASRGSLTSLSALTFLTPAFAAATGYLALGETLTPVQWAGAGVTLAAVALISVKGKAAA